MATLPPINPAIPRCPRCRAKAVIKKGRRKTRHEARQRWGCTRCGHTFTNLVTKRSPYPVKVIMEAIGRYNLGYSARDTVRYLPRRSTLRTRRAAANDSLHGSMSSVPSVRVSVCRESTSALRLGRRRFLLKQRPRRPERWGVDSWLMSAHVSHP
jgi:transposase-like protein